MLNVTHNTHSQSKRNIDEVLNLATTIMENVNMINYTQEEIKGISTFLVVQWNVALVNLCIVKKLAH